MKYLDERRPRLGTEGDEKNAGERSDTSIPPSTDSRQAPHADPLARARRHDHAVLVLAERADGVVCSQLFTNLAAAERKVLRTRERGLSASLTLVRLLPLPWAVPDEYALVGGDA